MSGLSNCPQFAHTHTQIIGVYQAHDAQFVEWMNEKMNEGIEVNQQRNGQSDGGESGSGGAVDLKQRQNVRAMSQGSFGPAWGLQPGRHTSGDSEKLLQRCRGKNSMYVILVKGKYMWSATFIFLESFCWSCEASASHEKRSSQWRTLVFCYI